jgi:transcriptional regulator with XRE-family HTH domain
MTVELRWVRALGAQSSAGYVLVITLRRMQDIHFGARVRAVPVRLGLRQRDVAARAGVSDVTVSRIERGHLEVLSLRTLRAVANVLEIRVDLVPRWRGGDLERLVSGRHAALAEMVIRGLEADAWAVRPEVSFAVYGERGVIDLLAWHAATRILLVIELKTEIVDVGELLATLDRKVRLAGSVAKQFGWAPRMVGSCVGVADTSTNRRRVKGFEATFLAAFPSRGRTVGRWLRMPDGALRGLLFVSDRHARTTRHEMGARKRVRVGSPARGTLGIAAGEHESRSSARR